MAIEKEIIIKVDSTQAVKGVDDIDKSINKVDDSTSELTGSLDKMSGGLITGFKNAVGGVKKGILAMKSLKIAIAATGVGLLVLAFGALVTFFTKSQKGMDLLSVAMAQFGAAVDVIVDRIIAIGEVLSNIFNKPLSETLSGIGDEFKGIGDELERDIKLAKELEIATQKLRDLERGQSLATAIQRKEIEKLRIESKDLTKTNEERVESLEAALKLEDFILQTQLKNQKERVRIARAEFDRANSTAADEQAFIDEKIKLVDLETASLRRQRTVITELESLKNQGRKAEGEGSPEEQSRQRVELIQTEANLELEIITTKEENITNVLAENEQRRVANAAKAAAEKERIAQLEEDAKYEIANIGFNLVQMLATRGSKLAKGAAAAQTLMNTYQGVTAALSAVSTIPEPFGTALKIANAAAVGVSGLLNVKKILSTDETGRSLGSGRPNTPGGGGGRSAPSFNLVQGTGTSQISNQIAGQNAKPVQAFVVSGNVTSQQELDRNANTNASL